MVEDYDTMYSYQVGLTRGQVIGVWVGVGFALLYLIGLMLPDTASDGGAWGISKTFVTRNLKSPKTAEFPSITEGTVIKNSPRRFTVVGYVDAQNSFGALIRSEWATEVYYTGKGQWRLRYLEIDNGVVVDNRSDPLPGEDATPTPKPEQLTPEEEAVRRGFERGIQ